MKDMSANDAEPPILTGNTTENDFTSLPEGPVTDMCALPTQTDSRDWLRTYLQRHRAWSLATFGNDPRPVGIVKHIARELDEILRDPTDLEEWVDVLILAFDGAARQGYSADAIMDMLERKYEKNCTRVFNVNGPDEPTEHVREGE